MRIGSQVQALLWRELGHCSGDFEASTVTFDGQLRDKLRKIEALFAGAATVGERAAAGAAAERIRDRLRKAEQSERPIEMRFSLPDPWSRQLFIALARRYGLHPYRYRRQRRTTIMLSVPQGFLNQILWPEFVQINKALTDYLADITEKIIRDEVYGETYEAEELEEPPELGR
jgi:hypothetical protein